VVKLIRQLKPFSAQRQTPQHIAGVCVALGDLIRPRRQVGVDEAQRAAVKTKRAPDAALVSV
jgi:hypothetical protein